MKLITRSVHREIWPPFLLGFAVYTFLLLVRTIFLMTGFFVQRSAGLPEVLRLVALSMPWIAVLTLPMAFLLGVLIGIGRLAGDSELIALRSCGVGPGAVYRPALAAATLLSLAVFGIYNFVLPRSNDELARSMTRVAATSVVNLVAPRTFLEPRPGVTLFFDRVGSDGRALEGVLLSLGDEEAGRRLVIARRGELALEGSRLWLDLTTSTVHEADAADPSRYRVNRNARQRILFAGDIWQDPKLQVSWEKGLRAQSLGELLRTAAQFENDPKPERYRLAWVEIHKKFSIPVACLAFAFLGIPLAETARRGGRGSSFALSLAILVIYYVLISSGETWAENGSVPSGLAMWLPNLLLAGIALLAMRRSRSEGARWAIRERLAALFRRTRPAPDSERRALFAGLLRFPALLDRYVLGRFFSVLVLVLVSVLLLAAIVDYADQVDEILRNHPPPAVVLAYYRNFLVSICVQLSPLSVLIAALVALGSLTKNSEDTAFKAGGVSLHRLGAPILAVGVVAAGLVFALGEYVLPHLAQGEVRYRNQIRGRPVDYGGRIGAERNWYYAPDGRIWHRLETDPEKGILVSPTVLTFGPGFELIRRDSAREAAWDGRAWVFRQGWTRTFGGPADLSYRTFLAERIPGEPPRAFARERRLPEEMRFRELERHVRRLRRTGYPTSQLETALALKISRPLLIPVMALLALPFAFRLGRRGALAGIGIGLLLGMGLIVASELFSRLGEVGSLPPLLAAWTPNVLFATAAGFLFLRLRT